MRIIRDSKGRELITTGGAPTAQKGRGQEIITTGNVEKILAGREKEEEAEKAEGEGGSDGKK